MQATVLFSTTLPSVIHNDEIGGELIRLGKEQNYPVEKVKFYRNVERYIGFGPDYLIAAKRLPPIPGGWTVTVEAFQPDKRQIMVNVKKEIANNGRLTGKISNLVLRMVEEYKKEGLIVSIDEEVTEFYGNAVRVVNVYGHPILVNSFEEFIEDMR